MNAPETIYIGRREVEAGFYSYPAMVEPFADDDIPYDQRKTCVWRKQPDGSMAVPAHDEHFVTQLWLGWTFCPYCGGRIEITDCDAKEEA